MTFPLTQRALLAAAALAIPLGAHRAVPNGIEVQSTTRRRSAWTSGCPGRAGPRIFDMIIDGVNMLLSERREVQSMLDQRGGDLERLIADLSHCDPGACWPRARPAPGCGPRSLPEASP